MGNCSSACGCASTVAPAQKAAQKADTASAAAAAAAADTNRQQRDGNDSPYLPQEATPVFSANVSPHGGERLLDPDTDSVSVPLLPPLDDLPPTPAPAAASATTHETAVADPDPKEPAVVAEQDAASRDTMPHVIIPDVDDTEAGGNEEKEWRKVTRREQQSRRTSAASSTATSPFDEDFPARGPMRTSGGSGATREASSLSLGSKSRSSGSSSGKSLSQKSDASTQRDPQRSAGNSNSADNSCESLNSWDSLGGEERSSDSLDIGVQKKRSEIIEALEAERRRNAEQRSQQRVANSKTNSIFSTSEPSMGSSDHH